MNYSRPIERHPLGFFLPEKAKLLMLGSFPPKRERWSMEFYYPNIQNDMWRIVGSIFFGNKNHFLTSGGKAFDAGKIKTFCREKGIALGDTAVEIIRLQDNASDKFLEVVTPFDPNDILTRLPECRTVTVTGQKAMDTLLGVLAAKEPEVGHYTEFFFRNRPVRLFRMPSTSRAYPKPLEEKAAIYRRMFLAAGVL